VLLHEASQKSFQAISATTIASTPDELKRHLVAEIARWKEITTNAGLGRIKSAALNSFLIQFLAPNRYPLRRKMLCPEREATPMGKIGAASRVQRR
jgi:hypothetical protein